MNLYLVKAIRDIKKKKSRSIPIIIIVMVSGIATIMYANITFSFDTYLHTMWEDNHYHHILLTTRPTAPDQLSKLVTDAIEQTGITPKYEIRSFYEGKVFVTADLPENTIPIRILVVNTSHTLRVDQLIYYSGVSLQNTTIDHAMLVDKANALKNDWKIGDTLQINYGNKSAQFTIVGLVASPEYIDQPKITSEYLGNWINPVMWISLQDTTNGTDLQTNQISLFFSNPKDKNTFVEKLVQIDQSKNILFIEGRNNYYETFSLIFLSIWILSSIIFMSTAIILVYMVLTFLIEEERQTLGVLTALGFNEREITFSFMFYSLILCLIGGLLGVILGILAGIQIVSNMFTTDFRSIPSVGILSNNTLVVCVSYILLITFVIVLTTIISSKKITSISPIESIKPNLNLQPGNKVFVEKVLDKMRLFLPPLTRFSLRSVFRRKKRAIFGIIAIAIATTVTLFGSFMYIGYGDNMNYHYSANERWDVQVIFEDNANINSSNIASILANYNITNDIGQVEPFIIATIRVSSDLSREYSLLGIQENSTMRNFQQLQNPKYGSLYLTVDVARRLEAKEHEFITIINQNEQSEKIEISQVITEIAGNGIFTSIETARGILRSNSNEYINGLYLKTKYPEEVKKTLLANKNIKEIILKQDAVKLAKNTLNQQITAFELSFLIGLITGLAISVIITSMSISERMSDFINFRAIGVSNREIYQNVFLEILLISIGGISIGLVGGIWILNSLFDFLSSIGVSYVAKYSLPTLVVPIVNILLGITLSTYFSLRSLFKASIAESTVSRTIG